MGRHPQPYHVGDKVKIIRGFNKGKLGRIVKVYPDEGVGYPLVILTGGRSGTEMTYFEADIRVVK